MTIILTPDMFVNNKCLITYGNREALFTIIDEEFFGNNRLGQINRITVMVRKRTVDGKELEARLCTTVIGIGDGTVGVHSSNPDLRGKLLSKDNMEQCEIELYENE